MPEHTSVSRNEEADRLAGITMVGIGRAMDQTDMLNAAIEAG